MGLPIEIGLLAAAGFLVYLAGGLLLRLRRPQTAGQLGAAHAELARLSQTVDGMFTDLGHRLAWAFPDNGHVLGRCAGCGGVARLAVVPGARGQFDVDYGWPLADDTGLYQCTAGAR